MSEAPDPPQHRARSAGALPTAAAPATAAHGRLLRRLLRRLLLVLLLLLLVVAQQLLQPPGQLLVVLVQLHDPLLQLRSVLLPSEPAARRALPILDHTAVQAHGALVCQVGVQIVRLRSPVVAVHIVCNIVRLGQSRQ
jgi:hypothetical protein